MAIHGMKGTRLHNIWKNMLSRCGNPNNPSYFDYGARGIAVCYEWRKGFVAFHDWALANGYGESLTIDRVDNDLGYSPNNCRWVTMLEQGHNKRMNKRNKTGVSGVRWHKGNKHWEAWICINGKSTYLGEYKDFQDAVLARKAAEEKFWATNEIEGGHEK
jgi:AP2 domain.